MLMLRIRSSIGHHLKMLCCFSIMHPLIDACSVSVLVAGGMTWERVLIYNFLAFAMQLPFGMMMDEYPELNRYGFFFGSFLVSASAFAAAFGCAGWFVLAAACIGNALFHLTAGKYLLEKNDGHSGAIGLFIATGALGLMAGQVWAAKAAWLCLPVFASALAVCVVAVAFRKWTVSGRKTVGACAAVRSQSEDFVNASIERNVWKIILAKSVLAGLFVLIAWRSWVGLSVSRCSAGECALLMGIGAVVTFGGKVAGGYIAEYVGRWQVVVVSMAGSVLLAYFCEPSWVIAWFVLLFVAQLATGPVLSLVYDRTGRRGGRAFGLNCFGLFAGSFA